MNLIFKWFWAPVKNTENSAQTVFRVLGNISRCIFTIWLVCCVVYAVLIIAENRKVDAIQQLRQNVIVTGAEFDLKNCAKDTPIAVSVFNNTDEKIETLTLVFQARNSGRSTNLLSPSQRFRIWDFIIAPHKTVIVCFEFSEIKEMYDFAELDWSASIWGSPTFFAK